MPVDYTKALATFDGKDVVIYTRNALDETEFPIVGAVFDGTSWTFLRWRVDGRAKGGNANRDLVNKTPTRTVYINIYDRSADIFPSRAAADAGSKIGLLATVRVHYNIGRKDN
jgi:hypothetical protein